MASIQERRSGSPGSFVAFGLRTLSLPPSSSLSLSPSPSPSPSPSLSPFPSPSPSPSLSIAFWLLQSQVPAAWRSGGSGKSGIY